MNKNILLLLGIGLLTVGFLKPGFVQPNINVDAASFIKPTNAELLDECEKVTKCFIKVPGSSYDAKRLASLYSDIASLIELDGEDETIKTTEEVRQANRLSGIMLQLDIRGKYPELSKKSEAIIVASLGDDSVPLDSELRKKAVEGFRALAWACHEGSK